MIDVRSLVRALVDAARTDPEVQSALGELREMFGASDGTRCERVEDCAKRLSVHPDTIRRAVDAGELEFVQVGNTIRIPITATLPRRRKRTNSTSGASEQLARAEQRLLGRQRNAQDRGDQHGGDRHLGHDRHVGRQRQDGNAKRRS